jgi:hypothetical protein
MNEEITIKYFIDTKDNKIYNPNDNNEKKLSDIFTDAFYTQYEYKDTTLSHKYKIIQSYDIKITLLFDYTTTLDTKPKLCTLIYDGDIPRFNELKKEPIEKSNTTEKTKIEKIIKSYLKLILTLSIGKKSVNDIKHLFPAED